MSFINRKHNKTIYIIFFCFFLNNCQLSEPKNSHGINFLINREKVLVVGKTNKNDVIKLIGNPHTNSIKGDDIWIYFERSITRGKMIKLGQNVLKKNNVLELKLSPKSHSCLTMLSVPGTVDVFTNTLGSPIHTSATVKSAVGAG